ncbi:MAG: LuxR C-terminal-related transcriptional regulator [Saprospiraceae bacterium]|nr:LuxR C-terminal-related transcriptional regulator [Saprospiraceae bacterium]
MTENGRLPQQLELRELTASLSALRNVQEVFEALIKVTPYPITMWNKDGKLLYANNNAIDFFGGIEQIESYCIWDDIIIKKEKSIIESNKQPAQIIPLASSPGILSKSKENKHEGIESIVCPVRNAENNIEIILIYFIDNSETLQLRLKNKLLQNEKMNLAITLDTITNLMQGNKPIKNTISEIIEKLIACLSDSSDQNILSHDQIYKLEEKLTEILLKYRTNIILSEINFTPKEKEICELLSKGMLEKEIAESLNVSYSTAHTHIKNIRKKLNLTGTKTNLKTYLLKCYG